MYAYDEMYLNDAMRNLGRGKHFINGTQAKALRKLKNFSL